ncbi:MAG: YeeE/YedE family protein, partial [Rhodoferax sp.]|nr:YeeE/YedE family protein [Rhodoferax sp.]
VLLWLNGRIAGVTGMLTGLLVKPTGAQLWRLLFLLGLVGGTALYGMFASTPTPLRQGFPVWLLVAAGLLTGYGTAQANGCTSGHGVCGLARFSVRSLVATGTFLVVAILTTYVVRHVVGLAT